MIFETLEGFLADPGHCVHIVFADKYETVHTLPKVQEGENLDYYLPFGFTRFRNHSLKQRCIFRVNN